MDRERRLELAVIVLVVVVIWQGFHMRVMHRHLTLLSFSVWGEDFHRDLEEFAKEFERSPATRATLRRPPAGRTTGGVGR
jgi:hypothetical protein